MNKLVEVFCDVDDFSAVFIPEWEKTLLTDGTRKRQRSGRMTMSEVMTIIIFFQMSHHRDFKNFYTGYLSRFYTAEFPNLLSYTRFLEVMPTALVPLCSYFASLKSEPTGIEFVDSTSIKVCHNLRIHRHKTLSGLASRGKGTMTGIPWRDIPKEFGCWNKIFRRFNLWSRKGVMSEIFKFLSALNDPDWIFIDGSIIKAHQDCTNIRDSKNEAVGSSRGGKSTKIHLAVDSGGLPVYFELSGGHVNDIVHGQSLVSGAPNAKQIVADKGYDSVRTFP